MAICNLFNSLSNDSGNFLMFSQYVDDMTCNYTDGDEWKVVPSGFVALNIDVNKLDRDIFAYRNGDEISLNDGIPLYLQNYFENACAYGRSNHNNWTPLTSRNVFWNSMFDRGILNCESDGDVQYIPEIVYYDSISMHSSNTHQGMSYGEIYCYIPTNAKRVKCQVIASEKRSFDTRNENAKYLEGFENDESKRIDGYNYKQIYAYDQDYTLEFDDDNIARLGYTNDNKFVVNAIVVMYDILKKANNDWEPLYANIPMGIYFAGKIVESGEGLNSISNPTTKFVSTSYSTGTSYGLRICTRFSAIGNGHLVDTDLSVDDSGYGNLCQVMTAMNKNLAEMMKISKAAINNIQTVKDQFAMIKNNRTNVPYVKNINGVDYWFVNGRMVSAVSVEFDPGKLPDYDELDYASEQDLIEYLDTN